VNPNGELEIHPANAETVRLILRVYTEERLGANRIRERLAALAIRPPSEDPEKPMWNSSVISRLLSNPVYTQGYAEAYGYQLPCPPIIDEKTFERAEHRRTTNKSLHPRRVHPWPLQGRITCGVCGGRWGVNNAASGRTYYCRNRERPSAGQRTDSDVF
jgi:hypothetical protein